jgi:hypothetical protein
MEVEPHPAPDATRIPVLASDFVDSLNVSQWDSYG